MGDDRARWTVGPEGELLGRELFEHVPVELRARWATEVLSVCQSATVAIPEVVAALEVGRDPARWREGHVVFDALRGQALLEERRAPSTLLRRALLDVAETTAKVVYNASGAPAPFDYHAGWRLAPRARRYADLLGDQTVSDHLWAIISEPLRAVT